MKHFPTTYQEIIYTNAYSRFDYSKGRRETWDETVDRYADFFRPRVPTSNSKFLKEFEEAIDGIKNLQVMPSMRALWTAGPALERENLAGFNCSFLRINRVKAFAEAMYLLMNGAGVGFSVERQYINLLPTVPDVLEDKFECDEVIVVEDSKEGWASALLDFLNSAYEGKLKKVDYSKIRPAGSVLKTFGGKASGPEPLEDLIEFVRSKFKKARGRKLTSLECHDICCYIARVVVVGGVRRSACISLSNRSDVDMAEAKTGDFETNNSQRWFANNSAVFDKKPEARYFLEFWHDLVKSQRGERGIFNTYAADKIVNKSRRRKPYDGWGSNPCCETILRDCELCNLTEVVVRAEDSLEELLQKCKKATILGILQSTLSNFNFVSDEWKKNIEEERLLGVSLTGLRDHSVLNHVNDTAKAWLMEMKSEVLNTASEWSSALGINMPAACTVVKPSGTVSQLVNTASGLHTRFAPYYIRRVRFSTMSPIFKFLEASGLEWNPENNETKENCRTAVFSFPVKAPEGSKHDSDVDAIEQLQYYLMLQHFWAEQKPSQTVTVADEEWVRTGAFVYDHWDDIVGVSFLPKVDHVYKQPPYEKITKEQYEEMLAKMPEIDFSNLYKYEDKDETTGARELACAGGACELA